MSSPFVWFHHNGKKSKEISQFFAALLAWKGSDGPGGLTMLTVDAGPFGAIGSRQERYGDRDEWIPFVPSTMSTWRPSERCRWERR